MEKFKFLGGTKKMNVLEIDYTIKKAKGNIKIICEGFFPAKQKDLKVLLNIVKHSTAPDFYKQAMKNYCFNKMKDCSLETVWMENHREAYTKKDIQEINRKHSKLYDNLVLINNTL